MTVVGKKKRECNTRRPFSHLAGETDGCLGVSEEQSALAFFTLLPKKEIIGIQIIVMKIPFHDNIVGGPLKRNTS